jgi:hypothetical protein
VTALLALVIVLIKAPGGCALAWWAGYAAGYQAAMAYRKVAADVEAGTLPVEDTIEGDAA